MLTRGRTSLRTLRSAFATAVLCTALALAGCSSDSDDKPAKKPKPSAPKESPRPGDQKVTLNWKGQKRVYTVHAPPGYSSDKKLPLVIAMHPYPSDGAYMAKLSGLSKKADDKNFLVAYPDGLDQGYNALVCCGNADDVGFIRTMTKRLTGTWNADPNRIYATGISNGGDMSFKLAVELQDTFAAIAPVSGGFIGDAPADATYKPKSPVSVITFIGGIDDHYDAFDDGIKSWQKRLGCKATAPRKLQQKTTRTTARCNDSSEVVAYRIPAMGHSWPGGLSDDMANRKVGLDATDLMWEFFAAHPKKAD